MGTPASQVITNDVDPWIKSRIESLYGDASTYLNNTPYQPYPQSTYAGFQPMQNAAATYLTQGLLGGQGLGFSTPQTYGPFGYTPMGVANSEYTGFIPLPPGYDPNDGYTGGGGGTDGGMNDPIPGYGPTGDGPVLAAKAYSLPGGGVQTMDPGLPPNSPAPPPSWNGAVQPIGPGAPGTDGGTYTGGYGPMSGQTEGQMAAAGAAGAMGYTPATVNPAMAGAYGDINAQLVAAQGGYQGMTPYQNAYENQVVQQSLSDLARASDIAAEQGIFSKGAGTYGGDRMGVQANEAYRTYLDRAGALSSQLRSQGFDTAARNAQVDASRYLQGSGLNQAAGLQAGLANQNAYDAMARYNAGLGMQGQLANQQAGLQGAGLNLQGALGLSGIGSQNLQNLLAGSGALFDMGAMGQQNAQGMLNADIGSYDDARNDMLRRFGLLQGVISGMPVGMSQTQTTSPNMFSQIGGLGLGLLGGLGGLGWSPFGG